jgi:cation transport ATPase
LLRFVTDSEGGGFACPQAQSTVSKIRQNLFWAFFYNLIMIPLAAGVLQPFLGVLIPPEAAATSMILSDITVVGNSIVTEKVQTPQRRTGEVKDSWSKTLSAE